MNGTKVDGKRQFAMVRRYNAPRELVFRAWTDPEQLDWFAGTTPESRRGQASVDLRVGGEWRVHLVEGGGSGRTYVTGGVYVEVREPEKLVFRWGAVDGWPRLDPERPDDALLVTVRLEERDGVTEMSFHVEMPGHFDDGEVSRWLAMGIVDGWAQTIDRLATQLAGLTAS